MSLYEIERLSADHDRPGFCSGLDSVDKYLKETARGHLEKHISITRVLVDTEARPPKKILGYFTLSMITVEATGWPGVVKGLPKRELTAVLLGRLAVSQDAQGKGIGGRLIALACQFASRALEAAGGIGMVVDAADESLIGFYEKYNFRRVGPTSLRLYLPTSSLSVGGG